MFATNVQQKIASRIWKCDLMLKFTNEENMKQAD